MVKYNRYQRRFWIGAMICLIISPFVLIYSYQTGSLDSALLYFVIISIVFLVGLDYAKKRDKEAKKLMEQYLKDGDEDKLNKFYDERERERLGPFYGLLHLKK